MPSTLQVQCSYSQANETVPMDACCYNPESSTESISEDLGWEEPFLPRENSSRCHVWSENSEAPSHQALPTSAVGGLQQRMVTGLRLWPYS